MKKYGLEKNKALKLAGQLRQAGTPGRFGSELPPDRREQRKLDQAAGLVPFALKLPQAQAERVRALAQERGVSTNDVVAELLQKALDA
ncbi:hypothetical protein [Bordetella holmesii]|uniref:Ribbon-helix-helix protein, CopG family n=2 Tax=Bordetella holmesii TaxID=35814 RepID=A0A158M477_9BORD|nr:hypothetical protein [Bordetella holmesii]AHV93779.1 ribbon-helix-helix, copG family protein [Bordetella holmesii ATCC 51541]AIT26339.1 ribbon-helix-helix, copG family protein [Bordetella holmesii 44057]EWM44438.1 ribbon-helix-helix, copG family protein [Bordetella holmesii 41130]EWM46913.1 ribbon-helix-helix, copG family protein [Bordetella holmesii 35009]EWM51088.1 ribbon-helix-helix, copG family protein [Bordetella holmesii 70147]